MIELLIFAGHVLIVLLAVAAILILIVALIAKAQGFRPELSITALHDEWHETRSHLLSAILNKPELKKEKKLEKVRVKNLSAKEAPRAYVLRFEGDIKAKSEVSLRAEINAVLSIARTSDEVVVVLESPGGVVNGYGLAASQLLRIREAGIKLTVCVDLVAASGGYLMSCVANQIFAAPFAIVGSIGVVAQVPNFNKVLKKYDVDFKEYTAGEFKRTVSLFGEVTAKGEEKFLEQLEETHTLFKSFVQKYRPQIDIIKVATGEYWYGEQAVGLKLIDGIKNSDDYLLEKLKNDWELYEITHEKKVALSEKIADLMGKILTRSLEVLQGQVLKLNSKKEVL